MLVGALRLQGISILEVSFSELYSELRRVYFVWLQGSVQGDLLC